MNTLRKIPLVESATGLTPLSDDPLWDSAAVCQFLSIADRTLRRWLSCGRFPAPDARLTARCLRWRRSTVGAWLAERGAGR